MVESLKDFNADLWLSNICRVDIDLIDQNISAFVVTNKELTRGHDDEVSELLYVEQLGSRRDVCPACRSQQLGWHG